MFNSPHIYQMPGSNSKIFRPLSEERLRTVPKPGDDVPRMPPNCTRGAGEELPTHVNDRLKVIWRNVNGDGNCFYRAISYFFTGSEEYYHQYRLVRKYLFVLHTFHMPIVLLER